ncbi:MAG TPA: hypothetical protein VGO62_11490 [Myxococcota bacterium]
MSGSDVDKLSARAPEEILTALASSSSAGGDAHVQLLLRDGHRVEGSLRSLVDARRGRAVLVIAKNGDASYALLADVIAVIVSDAARHLRALSNGALASPLAPPPGAGEPPTRLQLKRKLASLALPHQLEVRFDGVDDGEPMRVLETAIDDVTALIRALAADALGAQAIANVRFVLENASAAGVDKSDNTITIRAPLAHGPEGLWRGAALRAAVERVL